MVGCKHIIISNENFSFSRVLSPDLPGMPAPARMPMLAFLLIWKGKKKQTANETKKWLNPLNPKP